MKIKKLNNGVIKFYNEYGTIATINSSNTMVVGLICLEKVLKEELLKNARLYNVSDIVYKTFTKKPLNFILYGDHTPLLECNGIYIGYIREGIWYPDTFSGIPKATLASALERAEDYVGFIKNKPPVGGEVPTLEFDSEVKATLLVKIKNIVRKVFK